MRDNQQTVKIELLSQWKLEAEFRKKTASLKLAAISIKHQIFIVQLKLLESFTNSIHN